MKSDFPGAVPEIPVRDINKAVAYYQRSFGFTLDWGDEELGMAGISKGNCRMFLLYRLWIAGEARLLAAPESKPWACMNSPRQIRMATCSVCFMTSGLQSAPVRLSDSMLSQSFCGLIVLNVSC